MKYAIVFKWFLNSDDLIRMEDHKPHFQKKIGSVIKFLKIKAIFQKGIDKSTKIREMNLN